MRRRKRALLLGPALALVVAGCGAAHHSSAAATTHSDAAGPDHDATLSAPPAGRLVRVGTDPQGIAVDPGAGVVAVGVHDPSRVVLLSAQTGHIVGQVPIAAPPRHLIFNPPDGPFLVPEEGANRLLELSVDPLRQRAFPTGDFPHNAIEADGRIFVGDEHGRALTEIFPDGRERTIHGFTQPGGAAFSDGDLATVDVAKFTLTLMNPITDARLGVLPAGAGPTHATSQGGEIYVMDTRGDAVLTYTVRPFRQIGRIAVPGGPYGVAIDTTHRRLWVTQTGLNRLTEFSTAGRLPRRLASFPTALQPDTVAVDPANGRVFVANQISGDVEIIDPPS